MNLEFYREMMERTGFPQEAKEFLTAAAETVESHAQEEFDSAVEFFADQDFSTEQTQPLIDEIAEKSALSPYTVWLLLLMEAAHPQLVTLRELHEDEQHYWDTYVDFRCKALECKEIHGVWGTFVAFWYPIFFTGDLVKLGRLEFETIKYSGEQTEVCGVSIAPGDFVANIHIPSSGEPFTKEARLDSYRKAYDYFAEQRNGRPLVCVCHSWLLNPEYAKILPETSNVADFQRDFATIAYEPEDEFEDAWRLFGHEHDKPTADLPEDTTMRRAFKQFFLNGGKPGCGRGILVFDGEKLLR